MVTKLRDNSSLPGYESDVPDDHYGKLFLIRDTKNSDASPKRKVLISQIGFERDTYVCREPNDIQIPKYSAVLVHISDRKLKK